MIESELVPSELSAMTLGKRINYLRRDLPKTHGRHVSQAELARRVGVTEGMVGKWERDSATPDPDNRLKLAKIFRVPADSMGYEMPSTDEHGGSPSEPPAWALQLIKQQTELDAKLDIIIGFHLTRPTDTETP